MNTIWIVLPILTLLMFDLGLAYLFRLPPVFFIGLVLIACCPGGSSSNFASEEMAILYSLMMNIVL